ncbi:MAG: undecaprenyl/decaprenyl-phosphate alpha-N-acetylglucosaminyl 1-phosphate transferase [Cyclobacteriaceae bacterium]|nr:undecaprenyl/decaprenyl-phosphate alpha-N-acetylglucosaminyl 1-phosphate transferase [Cyclobacteriaceae bacterium]
MAILFAAAVTAFLISFLIVPVIIKYSLKKNLVDIPGRRKIHKKITPSMGGIAIFCGFFIASLIWIEIPDWNEIKFILVALFVIFFIGVRDDLVPLAPSIKLLGQILAVSLLILLFDLRLRSFYGLFGTAELPTYISYGITIFTIIIITNSFNLIDGLDGLAGTLGIISLLAFGTWFSLVGQDIFAVFAFSMAGAIIAFLIFNWEPSQVFMGDTGAMVIGMLLAIMAIHFININYLLPAGSRFKFSASIAPATSFIIIPLVDTCRIIILRLWQKKSPFMPDKSHIHHALMRLGLSHSKTTLLLGTAQLFFIGLVVVLNRITEPFMTLIIIGTAITLSVVLDKLILKRFVARESEEE